MGEALKEQIDNQHPKADPDCEGCWGSGWLIAFSDNPALLEEAGLSPNIEAAHFVMKCGECEVFRWDEDAIAAAAKAGVDVGKAGYVKRLPSTSQKAVKGNN
jgi:hypothetical protein